MIVVSLVIFTCFNAKVRKPTSRLKHSCSFTTAESRVDKWPVNYLSPRVISCCSFKGLDYFIGCSLHVIIPIIVSVSYLDLVLMQFLMCSRMWLYLGDEDVLMTLL